MTVTASDSRSGRAQGIAGQILAIAQQRGFKAGDRLIEQEFADALGLSRGPVRSGLRYLTELGLVVSQPNKGSVLADAACEGNSVRPLDGLTTAERVYRAIAEDRLDDRLPQVMSEAELTRRYNVTRPEMLRILDRIAAEGWVERSTGYGWRFVEGLSSRAAYTQSLEFRRVIEPQALLQPGYRLSSEAIAGLRDQQLRVLAERKRTLSIGEVFDLGCRFHEGIVRGAPNPFFVEALKRVNSIRRLFAYRLLQSTLNVEEHVEEHLKLLKLIEAGKLDKASVLLTKHLSRSTSWPESL